MELPKVTERETQRKLEYEEEKNVSNLSSTSAAIPSTSGTKQFQLFSDDLFSDEELPTFDSSILSLDGIDPLYSDVENPDTFASAFMSSKTREKRKKYTDEELKQVLFDLDDECENSDLEENINSQSDDEFWTLNSEENVIDLYDSDSSNSEEDENPTSANTLTVPQTDTSTSQPLVSVPEISQGGMKTTVRTSFNFSKINSGQKDISFTRTPGLRVPCEDSAVQIFRLLFNKTFIEHIVNETNIYALKRSWKPVSVEEFEKFMGLIFMMSQIKVPKLSFYWKKSKIYEFPTFSAVMSHHRFQNILRAMHFGRNPKEGEPTPADSLYKVRPLIDMFHENMNNIYYPKRELSIDEPLVLLPTSSCFRQYTNQKKRKHGIQLYSLTQANGLVLKMHVYIGSHDSEVQSEKHAEKVVKKLLEDFTGVGHIVFISSYYNSVSLTKDLLDQDTFLTGTLRRNRMGNPPKVVNKKLKNGEFYQQFTSEGICVMKFYKRNNNILMVSSEHDGNKKTVVVNGRKVEKPQMIIDYNKYMCGVNQSGQLAARYPYKRIKSRRWSIKFGLHIFHTMINNSYILYSQQYGKKLNLLEYRDQIIEELLGPIGVLPSLFTAGKIHMLRKITRTTRKRCVVCLSDKQKKSTQYFCENCPKQPALCLEPCFQIYHEC